VQPQVLHPESLHLRQGSLQPPGLLTCTLCLVYHGCQGILGLINRFQYALLFFGFFFNLSMLRKAFKKMKKIRWLLFFGEIGDRWTIYVYITWIFGGRGEKYALKLGLAFSSIRALYALSGVPSCLEYYYFFIDTHVIFFTCLLLYVCMYLLFIYIGVHSCSTFFIITFVIFSIEALNFAIDKLG
jgi:hypothetical protein